MRRRLFNKNHQILFFILGVLCFNTGQAFSPEFLITNDFPIQIDNKTWEKAPGEGDTIYIGSDRVKEIWFSKLNGAPGNPITVINYGDQVFINTQAQFAIKFVDCKYINITGSGNANHYYGIKLSAFNTGLQFTGLSSDCEASFIKIDLDGFFGIYAKQDYKGDPPTPIPQFYNLKIHDCLIKNVSEGMYLGETISPGMEFRHVEIYNNIVYNTGREAIQIANMPEDVKIYNNTLYNAGLDSDLYQQNILQIGDNSAAEVYNNILIGAESFGIISFGNGNNKFYNNYIANCQGIFIDNRKYIDTTAVVEISNNYFHNIFNEQIVRNLNGFVHFILNDNQYDTDQSFFISNTNKYELSNNTLTTVHEIDFTSIELEDFTLTESNDSIFRTLGAQPLLRNKYGINSKAENHKVRIYPNPFDDYIKVDFEEFTNESIKIKIMSIDGLLVFRKSFKQSEIFNNKIKIPQNLPCGSYLVSVKADNNMIQSRLIIKTN